MFYNTERPHSSLADQTPAEAYGAGRPVDMMDKAGALPIADARRAWNRESKSPSPLTTWRWRALVAILRW